MHESLNLVYHELPLCIMSYKIKCHMSHRATYYKRIGVIFLFILFNASMMGSQMFLISLSILSLIAV